jgi:hypothetical protein
MSQDKGNESFERFKNVDEIIRTLHFALDHGVKGVFFSTHPAIYKITDLIRKDSLLKKELSVYVNVPYIMKYVKMLNEVGTVKAIKTTLKGSTLLANIRNFSRAGFNVLTGSYLKLSNFLVDIELLPFKDLNVKAVFLHNGIVDLALGYNIHEVLTSFCNHVRKRLGAIPAFGTINFPTLARQLESANIEEALIMTSVNKKGFLMNPSRDEATRAIESSRHVVLAMATLASGSIAPEEAFEYLFSVKNIRSVIVGLSSNRHANETFSILRKRFDERRKV